VPQPLARRSLSVPLGGVTRLDQHRLTDMALLALEEVAAACHHGPVQRSRSLALALAYLASRRTESARWPFDRFWQAIASPRSHDRWSNVNASLNAIYLAVGVKRDVDRISLFEREARSLSAKGEPVSGTSDRPGGRHHT